MLNDDFEQINTQTKKKRKVYRFEDEIEQISPIKTERPALTGVTAMAPDEENKLSDKLEKTILELVR